MFSKHFEYSIMLNIIATTESIAKYVYSLNRMRQLKLPESLAQVSPSAVWKCHSIL